MSAYDDWLSRAVQDHYAEQEAAQDYTERKEAQLLADDDVLVEALGDSLVDPRTAHEIIRLFRAGDLLAAAQAMSNHVPTYVKDQAEVAYKKSLQEDDREA